MQKCGYGEVTNRAGQVSYVRVMGASGYPRFHAYVEQLDVGFRVNIHLDQKKPSYGAHTAHSGEYEGEAVENETMRVRDTIRSFRA